MLPEIILNPRRDFLKLMTSTAIVTSLCSPAALIAEQSQKSVATQDFLTISDLSSRKIVKTKDKILYIQRQGQGQPYKITFQNSDGSVNKEGYELLSRVFGDYKAYQAIHMDFRLFEILHASQQWYMQNGYAEPLIVTSGYRTFETNASIEGAAFYSMHLKGMALDIKTPGIKTIDSARIYRYFGASGIGVYPSFVHMDTGRLRSWFG